MGQRVDEVGGVGSDEPLGDRGESLDRADDDVVDECAAPADDDDRPVVPLVIVIQPILLG